LLLSEAALGQSTTSPLSFEVADIQVAKPGDQRVALDLLSNGRVQCHNVTLKMLIAAAYNVDRDRVTGGPDWLDSDHFDVAANLAGAQPGQIAHMVAGLVNPALMPPPPKEHKEVAVDSKLFDGYIGEYQLAPDFILTITRQGDRLFLQATGQPRFQIFPEGDRDFFLKAVDAQITFVTDSQGRATELILHQGGDNHAKRIK
jgi:hypothetical protein